MKKLLLAFYLLFSISSSGQIIFQKSIDSSGVVGKTSLLPTIDGGFISAGFVWNTGITDGLLLKFDSNGDTIWTKIYRLPVESYLGVDVKQTDDHGYILSGVRSGGSVNKNVVIKTDSMGEVVWSKEYSLSVDLDVISIIQTFDKGYVLLGQKVGFSDIINIIKIDENGDTLWTRSGGNGLFTSVSSMAKTADSCFVITGYDGLAGSGNGSFIVKMDNNGNTLWAKTYSVNFFNVEASDIAETNDGGFIITGSKDVAGGREVFLLHVDRNGNFLWSKTYGNNFSNMGLSVEKTSDSGYIIGGRIEFSSSDYDALVIKTDSLGTMQWSNTYGGNDIEDGITAVQNGGDGYMVFSTYFYSGGFSNLLFIKTDQMGSSGCNEGVPNITVDTTSFQIGSMNSLMQSSCFVSDVTFQVGSGQRLNTFCSSVGINEFDLLVNCFIYPNPVDDEFTLEGTSEKGVIRISDMSGKIISTQNSASERTMISCSELSAGIYFLNYTNGTGNVNLKIVK